MSLIKTINENASAGAVGAGSIATVSAPMFGKKHVLKRSYKIGSLFKGGYVNVSDAKKKAEQQRQRSLMLQVQEMAKTSTPSTKIEPSVKTTNHDFTFIKTISEATEQSSDLADVISKLDAAEKKSHLDKDTVTFGLEDENGNVVRVYVRADQAKEFEASLSAMLAGEDDNEDDQNTGTEIAEVLFKLKDRFDIVDVDWGLVSEDEEEIPQQVGDEEGAEAEMTADEQMPGGMPGEEGMLPGGDESAAQSALQQVIDMLKSDAEAKKAEADARAAEARAKEAEWSAKAAESKVKQEEQVLDMEDYYNEKQQMDKETKQLAKLAKWKHEQAKEAGATLSGSKPPVQNSAEEEEQGGNRVPELRKPTVSPEELRDALFYYLRSR